MKSETQSSWNESYSPWFLLLVCVFITSLLTSNIIAVKIISVSNLILPAAIIIFPISYIVGDVLTEVYGYSRARKVIWLGFLCNTFLVLFIWIALCYLLLLSGRLRMHITPYWDTLQGFFLPHFLHT